MIKNYTNQSITLKALSSTDEYGQPTYATSTIKARFEYKRKMIRNREGKEVLSHAQIFTDNLIKPDDVVIFDGRDWTILAVSNEYGLDGKLLHYEGAL